MPAAAADHFARALAAIRERRVIRRADGHLEMPSGITWPGSDTSVLFVRDCYAPMFEKVLHYCKATSSEAALATLRRRIVTGHPGIGKTTWGCVSRQLHDGPQSTAAA